MFVKEKNLIDKIREEVSFSLYYDTHYICKKAGKQIKKIENIIKDLKESGFKASRTHFCPTAIKTNASFEELIKFI